MKPVLFQIGDFYIPTYGFLIALGIFLAIFVGSYRMRRRGLPAELMYDIAFVTIIAGFLSARILYILTNFQEFLSDPASLIFSRSGFVFLGGLIGGVGAGVFFLRRKGYPVLTIADIAAPSIAIGHAVGRIACFAAGCCFGGVCEIPGVGVRYPSIAIPGTESNPDGPAIFYNAFLEHYYDGLLEPGATLSLPVWPVQLMESAGLFLIAGILILFARKKWPHGVTLSFYLILYSILRFSLEFFRGDPERGFIFGMSTSQFISLLLLPVGAGLMLWLFKNPVQETIPASLSDKPGDPESRNEKTKKLLKNSRSKKK